jgi:hypothetical protein
MCRSQAQGGRRCNGGGSAGGAADWNSFQPESEEAILARNPMARKVNGGRPLTEAQRRLYTLRDAGYKGAIDQDGYAVASHSALEELQKH